MDARGYCTACQRLKYKSEREIGTFFLIIKVCSRYFYVSHHTSLRTLHTFGKAVSLLPKGSDAVAYNMREATWHQREATWHPQGVLLL